MSFQTALRIGKSLGLDKVKQLNQLRKTIKYAPKVGGASPQVASLELTGAEYIKLAKALGIPAEALKKLGDLSGNIKILFKRFSPEGSLLKWTSNLHNSNGLVEKATASIANSATGAAVKVNSSGMNGLSIVANSYIPKNNLQNWYHNILNNIKYLKNGNMAEVSVAIPKTELNMSVPMVESPEFKPIVDGIKQIIHS